MGVSQGIVAAISTMPTGCMGYGRIFSADAGKLWGCLSTTCTELSEDFLRKLLAYVPPSERIDAMQTWALREP